MTPISAMSTTDPARASETEFPIPISADFPEAAAGLVAGQVLCNRYRVGEWIGGGGMADVFSGTDGWLARPVAIKVIKPPIATREMCRRMEQEGRVVRAWVKEMLASGRTSFYARVDGERTFLTTQGPLHDAAGQTIGLFGIARDITERQRAETEIRLLNAELEDRVHRRTAELERYIDSDEKQG